MVSWDKSRDKKWRTMPDYLELRGIPGYSFPAIPAPSVAATWLLANQLLANEWRPREDIEANQIMQLRTLVQFAEEQCPFYADRIRSCGMTPGALSDMEGFRLLPPLTRRDLQDSFQHIRARKPPLGTEVVGELKTSGSTGSPVRVLGTNASGAMWNACNVRDHIWAGLDLKACLVSIRHFPNDVRGARTPEGVNLTNWGGQTAQMFVSGSSHLMDVGMSPDLQIDFILKHNPDYVLSYPSNLETLGRILAERGQKLKRLQMLQTIGEVLPAQMRENIEGFFGVPVWDLYSCVEVGYVASQCPSGCGYHVHEENVVVEVLNDENKPCSPGETGRVVITTLVNYASPLIRYDLGDYATLMDGPCPCGRGLLGLKEIIGRQRGQILMPDGSVRFSSHLSTAIRDAGKIRQFQVVQHERGRVEILIVPMEGFGEAEQKKIVEEFQAYLGFPIRVTFTMVSKIERQAGGKYLDFVCKAK